METTSMSRRRFPETSGRKTTVDVKERNKVHVYIYILVAYYRYGLHMHMYITNTHNM